MMSHENPAVPNAVPESPPKEYLVLLVEETDRERMRFFDRYFAEHLIPCHKKGAWLNKGPSIKYFVPDTYYLDLCEKLGIEPDPVLVDQINAADLPEELPEEDTLPDDSAMPKRRWLPLLILVGGLLAALVLTMIFSS